jgi:hypothetical protein
MSHFSMRSSKSIIFLLAIILSIPPSGAWAKDPSEIQELRGSLIPGQIDVYLIAGLKEGQVLDALMENSSGGLIHLPDIPALSPDHCRFVRHLFPERLHAVDRDRHGEPCARPWGI